MKSFATQLTMFMRHRPRRRNLWLLGRFVLILAGMITLFSVGFHYIMQYEGQDQHSWLTGFYWTLTVMSTLGFGDILFESDLGRGFSIVVLLAGIVFMLVLLPFTIIQFFYAPWIEAKAAARAPDVLPPETAGHVVMIARDPVTAALAERCAQFGIEAVTVVADRQEALRLHDEEVSVMVGELDRGETYEAARLGQAAMLVLTADEATNATVAFVARQVAPDVEIIATSDAEQAEAVLKLAGVNQVLRLAELMGDSIATRTIGGDAMTHVIDRLGPLRIAEANASRTPLVGKSIRENRLRDFGVAVLGIWERGTFEVARPETMIGENSVLLLAGSAEQLESYDEGFVIYNVSIDPVIVVGGGRVGQATVRGLDRRGIDWRLIDHDALHKPDGVAASGNDQQFFQGNAADESVLKAAGIDKAPAVLLTPQDDANNIYLTLLLRHLRPDIQIVARAKYERNVKTLYRAGADVVMSAAAVGASRIANALRGAEIVPLAEGLDVVRFPIPASLAGRKLIETPVRKETGATVIAVTHEDGSMTVNPDPTKPLPEVGDLLLIGDRETERRFLDAYCGGTAPKTNGKA